MGILKVIGLSDPYIEIDAKEYTWKKETVKDDEGLNVERNGRDKNSKVSEHNWMERAMSL